MTLIVSLPLPPIENHRMTPLLIGGRARLVKSKDARTYQQCIALIARAEKWVPVMKPARLAVIVTVLRPRRTGDITARLKCLFDAMNGLAYEDDGQIDLLTVHNYVDAKNPRVVVSIAVQP